MLKFVLFFYTSINPTRRRSARTRFRFECLKIVFFFYYSRFGGPRAPHGKYSFGTNLCRAEDFRFGLIIYTGRWKIKNIIVCRKKSYSGYYYFTGRNGKPCSVFGTTKIVRRGKLTLENNFLVKTTQSRLVRFCNTYFPQSIVSVFFFSFKTILPYCFSFPFCS